MSSHDIDTIRTAYEEFAAHNAAAVLVRLDPEVEWVEGGRLEQHSRSVVAVECDYGAGTRLAKSAQAGLVPSRETPDEASRTVDRSGCRAGRPDPRFCTGRQCMADPRADQAGGDAVTAAAGGEQLDDLVVGERDDEHGRRGRERQVEAQMRVHTQRTEGFFGAVRRRRQTVRPEADPGEKGDQGDVLAGLPGPQVVPGRIEVLGKHTDYAGGQVLNCATDVGLVAVARPRRDAIVRVHSNGQTIELPLAVSGGIYVADFGIDGMGGGLSSLNKVCVIGPSSRSDADVDYTFAQCAVKEARVEYGGNCGNMSAAIGPFAVEEGLVASPSDGEAKVRIHNTNTGKIIVARFPVEAYPVLDGLAARLMEWPAFARMQEIEAQSIAALGL